MENKDVRILAQIELLATERGGRELPIKGSYRPNHNFFGSDNRDMSMGPIELPTDGQLSPGESLEVEMTLFVWPELVPELDVGRQWRIQEGAKIVRTGTILKLFA